ncbi:MAG: sugar ABC transporter permease [Candidatus Hadarchaeum sp.]
MSWGILDSLAHDLFPILHMFIPFMRHDIHYGYIFIFPATFMLFAVLVFPAFITIKLSFTHAGELSLINYQKALHDPILLKTFYNTFTFVTFSLLGHLIVGLLLALVLNRALPGQTIFRLIALIPWTIPDVITGIIFRWMLNPIFGCVNPLIRIIFPSFPSDFQWLSNSSFAFPTLILANIWRGYPLVMVMILAGLTTIPRQLYEAASVDGAGRLQRFIHITLPGLSTIIFIALALDMVWEFRRFALVLTMTGGGPGTLTEVLSTLVYKTYFQFFDFEYASTIAILMSFVLFILSIPYIILVGRKQ